MVQQLRNRRFETRLDATTDDLIARAADELGESRSTFVVRAAKEEAERILAPASAISKAEALAILLEGVDDTALAACPLLKGLRTQG
jgi:uncharacterized protein (DUF1778 family)